MYAGIFRNRYFDHVRALHCFYLKLTILHRNIFIQQPYLNILGTIYIPYAKIENECIIMHLLYRMVKMSGYNGKNSTQVSDWSMRTVVCISKDV